MAKKKEYKVKESKKEMSDLDKKLDFNTWRNRVEYVMQQNEQSYNSRGLNRMRDYVRGMYSKWIKTKVPISVVNTAYSVIKTMVASLYIRDPHISVNPVTYNDIDSANIQEQAINADWKELAIKRQVKKAIADAGVVGRGFIKLGYTAKIGKEEAKEDYNEYIDKESIWATYVPAEHIGYDLDAKDGLHDARFMFHWYYKPTDFLNEKYEDVLGDYKIMPTKQLSTKDGKIEPQEKDSNMTKVFEIYDKETGYMMIYCDGWDEWLEKKAPVEKDCIGPYKMKGFNFEMLNFEDETGDSDNLPLSPLEIVAEQLEEKIKMRSMQLNHVKRFSRQVFAKQDSIAPEEMDKYEKGVDGAVIMTQDYPQQSVYVPAYPPIQTDIYAIENKIDLDLSTVFGQSAADRGGTIAAKTRTLGEIEGIQAGSDNRNMERQDRVEDFCERIAKKLMSLQRQFYTADRYVRVVGDMTKLAPWLERMKIAGKFDGVSIKYTKDDIRGKYQENIVIGSSIPLNRQNRIRTATELLKVGQMLGLGPQSFASMVIGKEIFADMEMKNVERAFDIDMKKLLQQYQEQTKPKPEDIMKMQKFKMDMAKSQKSLETADNRMASNNQSTISKAIKNSKELNGANDVKDNLNIAKQQIDLLKARKELTRPESGIE